MRAALARALESKQIGGAALDVLEQEPPTSSPLLAATTLLTRTQVFYSVESLEELQTKAAEEVVTRSFRPAAAQSSQSRSAGQSGRQVRPKFLKEEVIMSNTPWKTDKWFVSPWNFNPAVNGDFKFAKKIEFSRCDAA